MINKTAGVSKIKWKLIKDIVLHQYKSKSML